MAKMSIIFDGFENLAAQIDRMGKDLHAAVDDALTATQQLIQDNLTTAAEPYAAKGRKGYAEGDMYKTILKDKRITWMGETAEVDVGFDLKAKGGWHSIFVMYGTPRITKDQKIYNAVKGTKTKQQIEKLQQEVMQKYLELGGK